ncbi:ATP-dependent DNA helicase [Clostridium chauvoei]|uniref:ATP-dependent DNA helicase n=2 Tax=Clostridium chauvoei TaxID=46867 RepID=A0ABD4RIU5_9CLOT|nr:ATP-dependent DNA helicase [Clostridium chauvoei]ATD54051.1 ATP-dependent helicase [Clostridium chauvoei]ATD58496.1 ATP-dependent helicase [Clostridium chauvoei]MBX7281318.1 ATP-dependent DNA helicase [Clostridium chauvoei]MBX7283776.1 ATP-dependent DNA helicase [Clostridium chauvoei]MBX7286407.1 ATP-dependent DNA helicase [Clostridium chauvoei]
MENKIVIRESVRGIIEYILRAGHLDDRYTGKSRALEGTLAHQRLQASNEKIYSNYEKEVRLEYTFAIEDALLKVDGRADGIIIEDNRIIIEEIKSTMKNLSLIDEDYNELHWAQAKFYSYIYLVENNLSNIFIRLSYYNIETNEVKSFDKEFNIEELTSFIDYIVKEYSRWIKISSKLQVLRNDSINKLDFPFETYRKGQRDLAVNCYNTIREKSVLFAQAPTGIGKTISTIFPAVKALGSGMGRRIIYLTAKTITRTVAEEAFNKLEDKGLNFRNITLTSKEKICFQEKVTCNPDECRYAVNYFTKVNDIIFEMLSNEKRFTREIIEKYAKKYEVCPFELSLDLSSWCDGIICDYNYAFDPRVRLKRFFEEDLKSNILLVDEGHNLVNRARDMFSAELYKSNILNVSKLIKGIAPTLYKALSSINKEFIKIRKQVQEMEQDNIYQKEEFKNLYKLLRIALKEGDEYLVKAVGTKGYNDVLELYFDMRSFVSISELYSNEYVTIVELDKSEVKVKLFCVNPSKNLASIVRGSYSTIIFSATLTPLNYYIDLLGGNEKSYRMKLPSPFKIENFKTYGYPLNMRYSMREKNIDNVCKLIKKFISEYSGNYMVFLPSYSYLNKVYSRYVELYQEEDIFCQGDTLSEEDRDAFINKFRENKNITAFCVVGGIFSEGIDLPGDMLIGSVVVGVGFPRISKEGDIIKDYYDDKGFDYAYVYPGINKVLQAAGRVIRTEEDKGRLLLIDDRYFSLKYRTLLPKEWKIEKFK